MCTHKNKNFDGEDSIIDGSKNKKELNQILMDNFKDYGYYGYCSVNIDDEKSVCTNVPEPNDLKSELNNINQNSETKNPTDVSTELNQNNPNLAVLYYEDHSSHACSNLKIPDFEKPERLIDAFQYLKDNKIFNDDRCNLVTDIDKALEKDLLKIHTKSYVSFIKNYSKKGGGFLGDSTYVTKDTYDVAKMSAGAAIRSAELVIDNNYSYSFALLRPPGHHAGKSRYGGFCIFNNAAILARYLQQKKGIEKVMIVDWDAHAGNGTMDIFYDDPDVITLSIHRSPHDFYPRTGFMSQIGEGAGEGYNINIEMPVGSENVEYKLAFDEVIIPLIKRHSPDFLICCCGFDGYYQEKTVQMNLTSKGYYQMIRSIKSVFPENFVILMEGGYHKHNGKLCHSVINALLDRPNPIHDDLKYSKYESQLHKKVYNKAFENIFKIKEMFSLSSINDQSKADNL
ncbi:histone deacetylase superfamily [Methanohalobium evestigatum Z-7303]|uniref:Histone deacetylase superfamily n=2 Tax=Methanohalobium evestigatum TaxID=2322 RepID=D7E6Z8_METEZ|nr:histone deacetylase superfamily [Methanohalobium evestigatum Z-7303]